MDELTIHLKCTVCQGRIFSKGTLRVHGDAAACHVSWSSPKRAELISFMCVSCGFIQYFGDLGQDFRFEEAP